MYIYIYYIYILYILCTWKNLNRGGPREPGGGHIPEIKLLSHALPASFPRGVAAFFRKAMVEDTLCGRSVPCKGSQARAAAEAANASETTCSSQS